MYGYRGLTRNGRTPARVQTATLAGAAPDEQGGLPLASVRTPSIPVSLPYQQRPQSSVLEQPPAPARPAPIGPRPPLVQPGCQRCARNRDSQTRRASFFCRNPRCTRDAWKCASRFHCCYCGEQSSAPGTLHHHHTDDCANLERILGADGPVKSLERPFR